MSAPCPHPLEIPDPVAPRPERPAPADAQDFPERHDDPKQAEELERQQDA